MKTRKSLFLLLILLLSLISISAISAADNSAENSINANELISDENIHNDVLSSDENENAALNENDNGEVDNLKAIDAPPLNFSQLNEAINGNTRDTIYLTDNYLYDNQTDYDYVEGIQINRSLTIHGNGVMIDGDHMTRLFKVNSGNVEFHNITFMNGNTTIGGAIYGGNAYDCKFIGNWAQWHGGAISNGSAYNCIFQENGAAVEGGALLSSNAYDCTFNDNHAKWGGAVFYGSLYNCNFTNNSAVGGGAVFRVNVTDCIFTNNTAESFGGAACEVINGFDSIFVYNSAPSGGAILLGQVNNCFFYNNTGNAGGAICNASAYNSQFICNNAAQGGAVYGTYVTNCTFARNTADEGQAMYNGTAVLCTFTGNDNKGTTIVDVYLNVTNFTSSYNSGERLLFNLIGNGVYYDGYMTTIEIYKDGKSIKTVNGLTGLGWIVDLDTGNYTAVLSVDAHPDVAPVNATLIVNKMATKTAAKAVTTIYNVNKYLVITLKDANGKAVGGVTVNVKLANSKNYKTDKNGQIKIDVSALTPKSYSGKISFAGDKNYIASSGSVKVNVKKATPKLTAKAKSFKKSQKTKKYSISLKTNKNKAMKNTKVAIKINKITYATKTNNKGVATFKITKLTKKGTFKSTIAYKGDKYYNKLAKTVKIKVV